MTYWVGINLWNDVLKRKTNLKNAFHSFVEKWILYRICAEPDFKTIVKHLEDRKKKCPIMSTLPVIFLNVIFESTYMIIEKKIRYLSIKQQH